jgi:hypothetical protein
MRASTNAKALHSFGRTAVAFLFLLASYACGGLRAQQPASTPAKSHQQIIVKVLNGKTGRRIWFASPYVFVGTTDPRQLENSYRRTRFWGDAHVDVSAAQPRQVRVWVDFIQRDCRYGDDFNQFRVFDYGGNTLRKTDAYDIDSILASGIVAPNLCSDKTQRLEPGVLTLYVIPETFKQLWNN